MFWREPWPLFCLLIFEAVLLFFLQHQIILAEGKKASSLFLKPLCKKFRVIGIYDHLSPYTFLSAIKMKILQDAGIYNFLSFWFFLCDNQCIILFYCILFTFQDILNVLVSWSGHVAHTSTKSYYYQEPGILLLAIQIETISLLHFNLSCFSFHLHERFSWRIF